MRVKNKNGIRKLLSVFISTALVVTLCPLSASSGYADENEYANEGNSENSIVSEEPVDEYDNTLEIQDNANEDSSVQYESVIPQNSEATTVDDDEVMEKALKAEEREILAANNESGEDSGEEGMEADDARKWEAPHEEGQLLISYKEEKGISQPIDVSKNFTFAVKSIQESIQEAPILPYPVEVGQTSLSELGANELSDSDEYSLHASGTYTFDSDVEAKNAIDVLENAIDVDDVSPNYTYECAIAINDPFCISAPNARKYNGVQQSYLYDFKIPALWNKGCWGGNSTIAIMDSHLNTNCWDISGRVSQYSWDFYNNRALSEDTKSISWGSITPSTQGGLMHGTTVTLTAAAKLNNSNKFAGAAYNPKILFLNIGSSSTGSSNDCVMAKAANYIAYLYESGCVPNIRAVNISFGGRSYQTIDEYNRSAIGKALIRLENDGIPVVVSAGNENTYMDWNYNNSFPASSPHVITVGATLPTYIGCPGIYQRNAHLMTSYTNWGPSVDVYAPGYVTTDAANFPNSSYVYPASGTSFASPLVAASVVLLKSAFPNATPQGIKNALVLSAKKLVYRGPAIPQLPQAYNYLNKTVSYNVNYYYWSARNRRYVKYYGITKYGKFGTLATAQRINIPGYELQYDIPKYTLGLNGTSIDVYYK